MWSANHLSLLIAQLYHGLGFAKTRWCFLGEEADFHFRDEQQNNPLVSAETFRHSSTYIILHLLN